jgi:murein DD-endopeptidase MepM/ murein hydrolase activator NlpD
MRSRFLTSILLIILIAIAPLAIAQRHHGRARQHGTGVAALRTKLSDLRRRKLALQGQLHANKALTHQTLQEITQVDQQLGQVEDALQQTGQQLADSRVKQKVVAGELQTASDKLVVVKDEVRARLRRIYSQGPTSSLSVLLGSHTGGELAARSEMLAEIAKSDRKIFDQYKTLRAQVADRKQAADTLVVQVTNLEGRQKAEQDSLEQAKIRKGQKIKALEQQAGELEEAIQQFQQDESQLTSQIDSFMRRLNATGAKLPAFVGGFARPVPGAITSTFGMRYHPILHITRLHAGIDFHAPTGTPVHAAASGIVAESQYMRGFGNVVMIAHGSDLSTVYGHLSRRMVGPGQHVTKGQVIGLSGATGLATGPHLHFEIRVHGRPVNPLGHGF